MIVPKFNVGPVPEKFDFNIYRIRVEHITFSKIFALPVETIGAALSPGGEPLKDTNGNLIAYEDIIAKTTLCKAQLVVSDEIDARVRKLLMENRSVKVHEIRGLDRRGHDLKKKASAFVRIDGAHHVQISNIEGETIHSKGEESAAVGFMLNVCKHVDLHNIRIKESFHMNNTCDMMDDTRPFSGYYLRNCQNVDMSKLQYPDGKNCSCILVSDDNVKLQGCTFKSPVACSKSTNIHMIN